MSRRQFEADLERKKEYLLRSMFTDLPVLSPIAESPRSQGVYSSSPPERILSPLPDLIIEPEKKTKHDEPDEFYDRLGVKMIKYYRQLFYGEVVSDLSDQESINDFDGIEDDVQQETVTSDVLDVRFQDDVETPYRENTTYESNSSESAEGSSSYEQLAKPEGKNEADESSRGTGSTEETKLICVVVTDEDSSRGSTKYEVIKTEAIIEKEKLIFEAIEKEAEEAAREEKDEGMEEEQMRRQPTTSLEDSYQRATELSKDSIQDFNTTRLIMEYRSISSNNTPILFGIDECQPTIRASTPKIEISPIIGRKRPSQTHYIDDEISLKRKKGDENEKSEPSHENVDIAIQSETYRIEVRETSTQTKTVTRTIGIETELNNGQFEIIDETDKEIAECRDVYTQTERIDYIDVEMQTEQQSFEYRQISGANFFFFF